MALSNDQKLNKVDVRISTNGAVSGSIWDTTFSTKTLNYTYKYKVKGNVGDNQTLTLVATDANGKTKSVSLNIEILPTTEALTADGVQKIYNILGVGIGAYDLNVGLPRAKAELETLKDLKDLSIDNTLAKKWGSGNGTKFVKVTTNDWTNATTTDYLYNLWKTNKATAITTVSTLTVGDIVLCQTGQTLPFNIYMIKNVNIKTDVPVEIDFDQVVDFFQKIDTSFKFTN